MKNIFGLEGGGKVAVRSISLISDLFSYAIPILALVLIWSQVASVQLP